MNLPITAVKAIIEKDGKILLLQRNPVLRGDDNWDLPGGLVEDLENEETTLIREIKEEIRYDIEIVKEAGEWQFLRNKDQKIVHVKNYIVRTIGEYQELQLSEEHISYKWILPEDIINYRLKDISLSENILSIYNLK